MRKYSEFLFLWHLLLDWYVLLESDSFYFFVKEERKILYSAIVYDNNNVKNVGDFVH